MAKALPAHSPALLEALRELTGSDPHGLRRVVIDIQAGCFPVVHIEKLTDPEGLVNVVRTLEGMCVTATLEQKEASDG